MDPRVIDTGLPDGGGITVGELQAWLTIHIAERLNLDPHAVDVRGSFSSYGLDSVRAAAMIADLGRHLGCPLSPVLLWEYPSIERLAAHLGGGAESQTGARVRSLPTVEAEEPVAVVGLACRFPKAPDAERFWILLREGVEAITEVPAGRWEESAVAELNLDAPEAEGIRRAGYLESVEGFDAAFFGISPREAEQMDPQQRLLLELTWEALEDAGIPPEALKGSQTGIFSGVIWQDYAQLHRLGRATLSPYTGTGQSFSMVANRISYFLGLQGPSVALDTACSSSLVAVHLACRSLRNGEATLALAGGVNLLLAPSTTASLWKFGGLSADGRCRPFDAGANGFVRGEGAGLVVLKPLSRALADGDRIYCVIRGSAVNNDGASNGLTAPNPAAQEEVVVEACQRAGIEPSQVDYVEAHGTGTVLGDPIEARALGVIYGAGRSPDEPLRIGSVKAAIGHLEGAAGIAGLIKVCLMLRHRAIAASLNFHQPNPHIEFEALHLEVPRSFAPWPDRGRPALAGVSSFGWGGTNCHVLVEESPIRDTALLPLAAESPSALAELAAEVLKRAASPSASLVALCAEAARQHAEGPHRLAVPARSLPELTSRLEAFLDGRAQAGIHTGEVEREAGPLVFVCSPQGSQWLGMGRQLLNSEPVFRAVLERCDRVIRQETRWSLLDELFATPERSRLHEVQVVQPVLVCLQVALAALWRSRGIEPEVVVGHSLGEISAAQIAGILDVESAARLACLYSRMQDCPACRGGMAIVNLPAAELEPRIHRFGDRVVIGGYNGPASTLLSGDPDALDEMVAECREQQVFCARVLVDVAVHAPRVEAIVEETRQRLAWLRPRRAELPMISTVTGTVLEGPECDGGYWASNLREPVRFLQVIEQLIHAGHRTFVEVSPHGVLTHAVQQGLDHLEIRGTVLPTLRREGDERAAMLETLGALFVQGRQVQWEAGALTPRSPLAELGEGETSRSARTFLLPLSAHSPKALRALAQSYAEVLERSPPLSDLCYTAGARRAHLEHRLALVARNLPELRERFQAFLNGTPHVGIATGQRAAMGQPPAVFVFPGQGSQYVGMGRQLYETEPVFRAALERCDALLGADLARPLLSVLYPAPGAEAEAERLIHQTAYTQPALFAVEYALAQLWRSWGIEPSLVIGHSVGEYVAAVVAEIFSLEDGLRLIAARGRLMQALPERGEMAAVFADEETVAAAVTPHAQQVSIAAINGPRNVVISGDGATVRTLLAQLAEQGITAKPLTVSHAFHSPLMEPMLDAFAEVLEGLAPRRAAVPFYSTVQAGAIAGTELDAAYWARNLRQPVLFSEAVQRLLEEGHEVFIEVSPHPVLVTALEQVIEAGSRGGAAFASLRRHEPERERLLQALGELYVAGFPVDWTRLHPGRGALVRLPSYPWQRQRHWFEPRPKEILSSRPQVPLPGRRLEIPGSRDVIFEASVSADALALPGADARGATIEMPFAVLASILFAAVRSATGREATGLTDVDILRPLVIRANGERSLRTILRSAGHGQIEWEVHDRPAEAQRGGWLLHAQGILLFGGASPTEPLVPIPSAASMNDLRTRAEEISGEVLYGLAETEGAPELPIERLWRAGREAMGLLRPPAARAGSEELLASRSRVDVCFRSLQAVAGENALRVRRVQAIHLHALPAEARTCWVRAEPSAPDEWRAEAVILDDAGSTVVEFAGISLVSVDKSAASPADEDAAVDEWLYEIKWRPAEPAVPADAGQWLVACTDARLGAAARAVVRELGGECLLVEASAQAMETALEEAAASCGTEQPLRVVYFAAAEGGLDASEARLQEVAGRCSDVVAVTRLLAGSSERLPAKLWVVTQGCQPVVEGEVSNPTVAVFWGLGRTLALEYPEIWGGLVDLQANTPVEKQLRALVEHVLTAGDEDQLALRKGGGLVPRLVRLEAHGGMPLLVRQDRAYLVTGGLGKLGLKLGTWLAQSGAGCIVLMSRTALPDPAEWERWPASTSIARKIAAVREIERLGATVRTVAADVADPDEMARLLTSFGRELPPLGGVVHAAGVIDIAPVEELDEARFTKVLRSKVQGASVLHELTKALPLDFFLLFSSASGIWGSRGLAHYAAANHFLDALAHYRVGHGLPALATAWGWWEGGGTSKDTDQFLALSGLRPMPAQAALETLGSLAGGGSVQCTVAAVDWQAFRALYEAKGRRPLFAELRQPVAEEEREDHDSSDTAWVGGLRARPREEAEAHLRSYVASQVASVLGLEPSQPIDSAQGFFRLGMDSLMTVELRRRLENYLGIRLPTTVAFEYPTIRALSLFLAQTLLPTTEMSDAASAVDLEPQDQAAAEFADASEDELALLLDAAIADVDPNSMRSR